MKIILLCNENFNQIALANKIASQFELAGIVLEQRKLLKKPRQQTVAKLSDAFLFFPIRNSWKRLMRYYENVYPALPETRLLKTPSVNSAEALQFIHELKPDLLVVSGTSILKKRILDISIPNGIVNLHTGISPYVKGGPNCTNWCIARKEYHLIGNTIMWIDPGIDSGDIIASEQTKLTGEESLLQVHIRVMDHAHDLYCRTIKLIKENTGQCKRVSQSSLDPGNTFYTKDWNFRNKLNFLINLIGMRSHIRSNAYRILSEKIRLVPLHNGD